MPPSSAPTRRPVESPEPCRKYGLAALGLPVLLMGMGIVPFRAQEALLLHYDFSPGAGEERKLPAVLEEISGLATTGDGRLFAHHDERAIVYQLDPGTGQLTKAFSVGALGIRGDFEGLAIAGDRFFLVSSGGTLIEFREGEGGSSVGYLTHSLGLGNRCEFEGLAYDEATDALLLPCKTAKARSLRDHVVIFSVPLKSMKADLVPRIFLPFTDLAGRGFGKDFHPSAIEVHPLTRSLILLGAQEEAVVELSPNGEVLATKELKRKDHPQPEGVAFLLDGSLVLADEGQGKRGTLTRYRRKEPKGEGGQ